MSRFVVDSSVVIKWWIPEVHSGDALRYLDPDVDRDAPEWLVAELCNILWKKVGRGELTTSEAEQIAAEVTRADVILHAMGPLCGSALRVALATGRSAYDCLNMALAESLATRMVTADRRLYNAVQGGPYAHLVHWVEHPF